jgi:PAT family beta-lactamase induction signal transducer AmpG
MDRFAFPLLGKRRGWMLVTQIAVAAATLAMASVDPSQHLGLLSVFAVLVAFFSASQDIVLDAYRTEILTDAELGPGSSLWVTGYRIGMVVSSALAIALAGLLSWGAVYAIMASSMLVGIAATLMAPEPRLILAAPKTFADAVIRPFAAFLLRRGSIEMLVFILIFKLDVALTTFFTIKFITSLGFTNLEISVFPQALGIVATIIGALIGGAAIVRIGIYRALWTFGLLQGLSGLSYALLAATGHNLPMMVTAVVVENLCAGMGTAAYTAFLMSICDKHYTASQYALFTSLMALSGRILIGPAAGWLQAHVGWPVYFVIATVIAAPGLLLLFRYKRWTAPESSLAAPVAGTPKPS